MASSASPQYRFTHLEPATLSEVVQDAPELSPLIKGYDDVYLYTRSSAHFATASKVWNWNNTAKPLAVARCLSTSAVQRVVRFCSGLNPDGQQNGR